MAKAVFDELGRTQPKHRFTVGIVDDVSHTSLDVDHSFTTEPDDVVRAVFYGLGSDGTVGANKSTIKIIGEDTDLYAQGYFVYDSKKSGSMTVSHLRFGPRPIRSTYLIARGRLRRLPSVQLPRADRRSRGRRRRGRRSCSTARTGRRACGVTCRRSSGRSSTRDSVLRRRRAGRDGRRARSRINTSCRRASSPSPASCRARKPIEAIKAAIARATASAASRRRAELRGGRRGARRPAGGSGADGVTRRSAPPAAGSRRGSRLCPARDRHDDGGPGRSPAGSALPVDGTFPDRHRKVGEALHRAEIPIWDPSICIDCAKCALVCPHAAIRMKVYEPLALDDAPDEVPAQGVARPREPGQVDDDPGGARRLHGLRRVRGRLSRKDEGDVKHKAIDMAPKLEHLERERANFEFFLDIPPVDRADVKVASMKGSQMLRAAVRVSGACAGCGETPYLKLLSQMFGDRICRERHRMLLDLRRQPADDPVVAGRGRPRPGVVQLAVRGQRRVRSGDAARARPSDDVARSLLGACRIDLDRARARAPRRTPDEEARIADQRERVAELSAALEAIEADEVRNLVAVADALVRKSVWIVGGDGWAYDIGFGGLDHVLACGPRRERPGAGHARSTRTPAVRPPRPHRGARWRSSRRRESDRGRTRAVRHGLRKRLCRADRDGRRHAADGQGDRRGRSPGSVAVIAYSHCIAHGIDMSTSMSHQAEAVNSGFWPLWRYDPRPAAGQRPMRLDSREPTIPSEGVPVEGGAVRDAGPRLAGGYAELSGSRRPTSRRAGACTSNSPASSATAGPSRAMHERPTGGGGDMSVDLRTPYLGLELATRSCRRRRPRRRGWRTCSDSRTAGASAIVMPSLFEEQIEHDEVQMHRVLETGRRVVRGGALVHPEFEEYNTGPDAYLRHLEASRRELAIPVIGSLNGMSEGGWIRYARLIQDAGADALELNVYFIAADPDVSGAQVEQRYLELVVAVRESVTIPLAVKVGPYFSSMANMAGRFVEGGRERARPLQPVPPAGHRPRDARVDPTLTCRRATRCGCRCGGSRCCTAGSRVPSPRRPACGRPRTP